jgi:hypothetical protein
LAQIILELRDFKFVPLKGYNLFKGEIITIMEWGHLKISPRITRPEPVKLT